MIQDIFTYIADRFQSTMFDVAAAAAIGVFGWYFAYTIGGWAAGFLERTKLNQTIKRLGWNDAISRIYRGGSVTHIFGKAVEIWILLFFLMVCSGILGLESLSQLLQDAVKYFVNIFVAFLIFGVAVLLVDVAQKAVAFNAGKGKFVYSQFLGKLISGTVWTLAVLAVLYQLKIIAPLVLTIFIGIVVTISVAAGVALGLGGKDLAAKILKEIEERLK